MTGHAGFGGRQSGEGRLLDRRMAIAAVETETRGMMLMAEWDRLGQGDVLLRGIGRTINGVDDTPKPEEPEEHGQQRHASDAVAAFSKNLRHVPVLPCAGSRMLHLIRASEHPLHALLIRAAAETKTRWYLECTGEDGNRVFA